MASRLSSSGLPAYHPRVLTKKGPPAIEVAATGLAGYQTMTERPGVSAVLFDAPVSAIDKWTILRLPENASKQLPSRGQVAVSGTINGYPFQTVVEPDGTFGHWIKVDAKLQKAAALTTGARATVEIAPIKEWPEPSVPTDLKMALAAAPPAIQKLWKEIIPMARWEWVRWVNETKNPDTRRRRVDVTISKMQSGKRRPCCFNLAACTDPDLAKSGKLVDRV